MPSIPNRTDRENQLASIIDAEFEVVRAQSARDPRQINYEAFERDTQKKLAEAIALIYLLAMAGMEAVAGHKNNRYVAIARATDYANERAAQIVVAVSDDLRTKPTEGVAVADILSRARAETIAITEITAAISAGEFAVGKPDAARNWLALILLYGLPGATDAWLGNAPGQTARELIGWPRPSPLRDTTGRPGAQTQPPPTPWPATPSRPAAPASQTGSPAGGSANPNSANDQPPPNTGGTKPPSTSPSTLPSVLMAIWVAETEPGTNYPDSRVCPICLPLHNQSEEIWSVQGPPPAHPRCRCTLRWLPFEQIFGATP
jgi:hypothetical protein